MTFLPDWDKIEESIIAFKEQLESDCENLALDSLDELLHIHGFYAKEYLTDVDSEEFCYVYESDYSELLIVENRTYDKDVEISYIPDSTKIKQEDFLNFETTDATVSERIPYNETENLKSSILWVLEEGRKLKEKE